MSVSEIAIIVTQFLLSLSLLIILHEWGHYFPAKKFKTKVEKFYLFFDAWGKKLFSFKYKGTEYGIGWLPLGGYVKIAGMIDESMDKEQMKEAPKPWEFRSKPAWQRLVIMLGGVTVNFILAWLILVFVSFKYGDVYLPNENIKDGLDVDEFVQEKVGLMPGDKVISIDGYEPKTYSEIQQNLLFGEEVIVDRNGKRVNLTVPEGFLGDLVDQDAKSLLRLKIPLVVGDIEKTSLNASSGLEKNDVVVKINDKPTKFFKDAQTVLLNNKSKTILITVLRDGKTENITAKVNKEGMLEIGLSGITLADMEKLGYYDLARKEYSFGESLTIGSQKFVGKFDMMIKNIKAIGNPKTGAYKGVGSFISIAKIFPKAWDWEGFWNITAFLSIMLGVLNLLPIPALDGGHALFVIYEMIFKKKPSEKFLERAQLVGFILLMSLFVYAFGNDIYRHFIK